MSTRKWTDDQLKEALKISFSKRQLTHNLGLSGHAGYESIIDRAIELGYDVSNLYSKRYHRGNPRISDEDLATAVANCNSFPELVTSLGYSLKGGSRDHMTKRIKRLKIDTSHFVKTRQVPVNRKTAEEVFVQLPKGSYRIAGQILRKHLIASGIKDQCAECGQLPVWNNKPLVLQVDHIDGNSLNNLIDNLHILCPNCHTQTDTYGNKKRAN